MTVYARSNNDELFNMMRSLIPDHIQVIKVTGFNHWQESSKYLYHILEVGKGWIINLDIDCFIYDWEAVWQLVLLMEKGGYTHAGPHDGGNIPGRSRHWAAMNPFFNVFNVDRVREVCTHTWKEIEKWKPNPEWNKDAPEYLNLPYNDVRDEPFHGLFLYLYQFGKPYYLRSFTNTYDQRTTDIGFAFHTWYSRLYHTPEHKERINNIYELARNRSALQRQG